MLDRLGIVGISAVLALVLATVLITAEASRLRRLLFALIFGLWVGVAIVLTASGFARAQAGVPLLFAAPLAVIGILAAGFPAFRASLIGMPASYLIGLNVVRLLGVDFLLLLAAGQLGGPFPYFAGIGDIVTGLFALPVARLAARGPLDDPRIIAWNFFGMLDLIVAVTLGVLSGNGSRLQLIHAGAGSAAVGSLPWSIIPQVLVPLFLIGHTIVWAKITQLPLHYLDYGGRRGTLRGS